MRTPHRITWTGSRAGGHPCGWCDGAPPDASSCCAATARAVASAALILTLCLAGAARADVDPDTEVARRHFQRGSQLYDAGHYDEAIAAFEAAKQAKPLPAFDYNIGRAYDRLGAPRLVIPGAVAMAVTLGLFTRVTPQTSPWLVLAEHVVLMVALALIFTPVFTSGLGVLPPHLYTHGSAVLGSLQQVAAAAGTAIVVSVMAGRAVASAGAGATPIVALSDGIRWGFGVGAVLAVVAVAIAFAVRTPATEPSS